jgi:malonate decarboxylase beta subunit
MTATVESSRVQTRVSIAELSARERAQATLDLGTFRELLGPFDHLESPWLALQGVVPQEDDGVVLAIGGLLGKTTLVIAIEPRFQGGSVGEVSGTKISAALSLALRTSAAGRPVQVILFLESGGVRLQEANLGLAVIAEIQSALLELRRYVPVTGIIAGPVGCFGGMAITAGLCSYLLMTREGRLGLNGPEVIEQEAGVTEMDATDRPLIWSIYGGESRQKAGLIDQLIEDDLTNLREAFAKIFRSGPRLSHRSENISHYRERLASSASKSSTAAVEPTSRSRGRKWFSKLAAAPAAGTLPSVLQADVTLAQEKIRYLAVVPDPQNHFPRARNGEVGLEEAWNLAACIRETIATKTRPPAAIVAIVDVPSQAYGRKEEELGLFLACAAAADAYAAARTSGHPVITLVVGQALSGGFLAHGYQAHQILALRAPGVTVQAMGKESAARVTRRSVSELESLGQEILPMSYDLEASAQLGIVQELITVENADAPTSADVERVQVALLQAIAGIRSSSCKLEDRLNSPAAHQTRQASLRVRATLEEQWRDALAVSSVSDQA